MHGTGQETLRHQPVWVGELKERFSHRATTPNKKVHLKP